MNSIYQAHWIKAAKNTNPCVPEFFRDFSLRGEVKRAELNITALGVFYAQLNGKKIGDDIFAPGWTSYTHRLQYMTYDATGLLQQNNHLSVCVGRGWRFHKLKAWGNKQIAPDGAALLCALTVTYTDGTEETILSDENWFVRRTATVYNDMYNGETYDATKRPGKASPAVCFSYSKKILLPLEGVPVKEHEIFDNPKKIITPKGETVLDFGQELTGYVQIHVHGKKGDRLTVKHFEVLDKDGNVYTENLRAAKQTVCVICSGTDFLYQPKYTFYGFRYIQIEGIDEVNPADFKAIAVYSDIKQTSSFSCSVDLLNQLYHNVLWGQKGNFLDVPTDCPQRDERLGWTGDAQIFARTAAINFDVEKFFEKWLSDLASEQTPDGEIPCISPAHYSRICLSSAAWSDAAVIIPWQMYLAYGNLKNLEKAYPMMKKYVDFMASCCEKNAEATDLDFVHPWKEGFHYGDWLALDQPDPEDSNGRTNKGLIATAYLAYDLCILIKTGKLLGQEMSYYEKLYEDTVRFFRTEYMQNGRTIQDTQTAPVLALFFNLTDDAAATGAQLAEYVQKAGHLTTGFVGTAYLLHALSLAGRDDLAVSLLLRTEYPSWLYPVTKGATTVWERWNGIHPDGHFANKKMNSFNHYAYGAVFDWIFSRLAGINPCEEAPGYRHIRFTPMPDARVAWLNCSKQTAYGEVKSAYRLQDGIWHFVFTVPEGCTAEAELFGKTYPLHSGENNLSAAQTA